MSDGDRYLLMQRENDFRGSCVGKRLVEPTDRRARIQRRVSDAESREDVDDKIGAVELLARNQVALGENSGHTCPVSSTRSNTT